MLSAKAQTYLTDSRLLLKPVNDRITDVKELVTACLDYGSISTGSLWFRLKDMFTVPPEKASNSGNHEVNSVLMVMDYGT